MISVSITWKLEYDSVRDVAIPISHWYDFEDWYLLNNKIVYREFSFTDSPEDKVSFDVKDYCKNVDVLEDKP